MKDEISTAPLEALLAEMWQAVAGGADGAPVAMVGTDTLPSVFAVSDLAAAAIATAGRAVMDFAEIDGTLTVDRRLASFWFGMSVAPTGWPLPPVWDVVAGDYQAADGWIRLHTNAPHHRAAALLVLGTAPDRAEVTAAVAHWSSDALEAAIVAAGGCAAAMRDAAAWRQHPQGAASAAEPLLTWSELAGEPRDAEPLQPARPLAGIRVLDLTRILAGPIATRFLAAFGAEVLRLDPPDWAEPSLEAEVTLGKRCARLDLKSDGGRGRFLELLAGADILIHGYRPDALDRLGLGAEVRAAARPGLVDIALDAYGWTGPWAGRRGFDSLVQMSAGIAAAGMAERALDRPGPLPVQALDHATGYLLAAAAVQGLARRRNGGGHAARASLARTAHLLLQHPSEMTTNPLTRPIADDYAPDLEQTPWGPARRLRPPLSLPGAPMRWDRPASALGSAEPAWS
ncbi:MAG: CoA transferase [Pseudomonadota bacterium]